MNLIQEGSHAAADWLRYKVRATYSPLSLHVLANGEMVTREARRDRRINQPTFAGIYSQQAWRPYTDTVAELTLLRDQLMVQQEVTA